MAENLSEETRRYVLDKMRAVLREGGRKMPTERELAGEILASYATLRLVMKALEREGFIRKIRGSGTYLEPRAAELLESAGWPKVRLFSSPLTGTPDDDYAAYLVGGLMREARANRFRIVHEQVATHDAFLAALLKKGDCCDPVIYLPPTEPFTMRQLGELGRFDRLPLLVIECEIGNISINNITTDNRKGGAVAAQALLDAGCRRIALLVSEPQHLRQISHRILGFRETAQAAGVTVEIWDCEVGATDDRIALSHAKTLASLRTGRRPDGIFAVSDSGAFGALRALEELKLAPGKDLLLVGFDGLPAGTKLACPLTTVAQPVDEISRTAIAWLSRPPHQHFQQLIPPNLREGDTLPIAARPAVSQ